MGMIFYPSFSGDVTIADGTLTDATFATDAIDANALANDAVTEILDTVAPASPTAGAMWDILSKTDNNTYARSTDSLEAISDAIASLTTGTFMQRSSQSASLLMDGTEQTLFELAPGAVFEFGGGSVYIPASAGAAAAVKVYVKNKSGGSYIDVTPSNIGSYNGTTAIFTFGPIFNAASNAKHGYVPRFNRYGVKVTLQQGTVGAGYVTVDHEWFNSLGT